MVFVSQISWAYRQIPPNRPTLPAPTPPVAPLTLRTACQTTNPTTTPTATPPTVARCPCPILPKPTPATARPTHSTSRSTATTNTTNMPSTANTVSTNSTPSTPSTLHTLSTGSIRPTSSTHSSTRHTPPNTRSTASTLLSTDSSIRAFPTSPILPSNRWPATQVRPSVCRCLCFNPRHRVVFSPSCSSHKTCGLEQRHVYGSLRFLYQYSFFSCKSQRRCCRCSQYIIVWFIICENKAMLLPVTLAAFSESVGSS